MADIRKWNKELIADLIALYKSLPCLWKVKSKEYKNKNLKEEGYKKIIDFFKEEGFSDANRDFVVKKLQSLRGSFRKELKKITESQRSGNGTDDVYKPTLWYFDSMLFTKDQDQPIASISNNDGDSEDEKLSVITNEEGMTESEADEIEQQSKTARGTKRKAEPNVIDTQIKFMNVFTETLKKKEMTEYEALSVTIAKKLEKMNSTQVLYAETIINSVLRRGLLNQLTDLTDICDKQCNKTIISSPSNTPRLSSSTPSVHTEDAKPFASSTYCGNTKHTGNT